MKGKGFVSKAAPGAVFVGMENIAQVIAERVNAGQSVELPPRGISMLPLLREGRDSVILSPKPEHLEKYDIPLYQRESGGYVLHRIVGERDGAYVLVGDNQYAKEYGIKDEQIIAVVSAIRRGGRLFDVKHPLYLTYVYLWCAIRPARHLLARVKGKIARILIK